MAKKIDTTSPTHFAVPADIFEAVLRIFGSLPYSQVQAIMVRLQDCQPLVMQQSEKED